MRGAPRWRWFLREPLLAHPCALGVGHPWPPTFSEGPSPPRHRALEFAINPCREKRLYGNDYPEVCLAGAGVLPETVGSKDAAVKRTGTYLQRVSGRTSAPAKLPSSKHLDSHCRSFTTTNAEGCDASLFAVTLEGVHKGYQEAGSGGADRVALCACAAVDVNFLGVQA